MQLPEQVFFSDQQAAEIMDGRIKQIRRTMKPNHPRAYTAPKVSKRNRHTGRINDYKRSIINNAKSKFVTDANGVKYAVLTHRLKGPLLAPSITASQIVRV